MFHRDNETTITLEMFEVSANNACVMGSTQALKRDFPGTALEMPREFLCSVDTLNELSRTLAELAVQQIEEFVPIVHKASKSVSEIRDTASPTAITGALTAMLLAYGKMVAVTTTRKKIRDEVSWANTLLPWRRPSMWAVLRIATQRLLERVLGPDLGRRHYKNLQIVVLSELCRRVTLLMPWSDELFFVRAKLGRRLDKLQQEDLLNVDVDTYATKILQKAGNAMDETWKRAIIGSERHVSRCKQPASPDTRLLLRNSGDEIATRLDLTTAQQSVEFTGPDASPMRSSIVEKCTKLAWSSFGHDEHNKFVSLYDFEVQVRNLDCGASLENIGAINTMFANYDQASMSLYMHNADSMGVRALTLMLLWVQLDRIALRIEPSLRRLSTDIPVNFMRHLRLTTSDDLSRVQQVEGYLQQRKTLSGPSALSPFQDKSMKAFACEFYDDAKTGSEMRHVHERVQKDTAELIRKKTEEWRQKKQQCQEWHDAAAQLTHTYFEDEDGEEQHSGDCRLCALERLLRSEQIMPFEEPLPKDALKAKWILFELLAPDVFRVWREVTWRLINDIGRPSPSSELKTTVSCLSPTYPGLYPYHSGRESRLCLASEVKSFLVAHYGKSQNVDKTTFDKIHLPHGPQYFLFDKKHNRAVQELSSTSTRLLWRYSGLLPRDGLYETSKQSISGTSHTPNEILSNLPQCPPGLSLFEFQAFNILRSGESLQWLNILTELASPSLHFAEDAPQWLITQAALEVGSQAEDGNALRKSHRWLEDPMFCCKLVELLARHVAEVGDNWNELSHLRTILILTLRLENLASQLEMVVAQCRHIRTSIRKTACGWTRQLRRDITESENITTATILQNTQLYAALLCRATYTNADDLAEWGSYFEAGFVVANGSPVQINDVDPKTRHELLHDWRKSCEFETRVVEACTRVPERLSIAVGILWPRGRLIRSWARLKHPQSQWLWAQTEPSHGINAMQVHVNILTGDLLVQGKRLGQLPDKYRKDELYREVFGSRKFEVLPSDVKGMTFTATIPESSFPEYLFGWSEGGIRLGRANAETTEILLPRETFRDRSWSVLDLPGPLIKEHLHWLCTIGADIGRIHVCPSSQPLCAYTPNDWAVRVHDRRLTRGKQAILDPSSETVKVLGEAIGKFEYHQNLVIWVDDQSATTVSLPRFNLTFQLTSDGQLICPDLNGRIVESQSFGTLIGLSGHLLMADENSGSPFVVVPHGNIICTPSTYHTVTSIDTSRAEVVTFSKFVVNDTLSRLDCSGEAKDMLLKAYLHAVTSGFNADPFLARRGAEEALVVLREFLRQLYSPLDEGSFDLLKVLAKLTATRQWYPTHLKVMQTSSWRNDVPVASQMDAFLDIVSEIIDRSNQLQTFYTASSTTIQLPHNGAAHLHKRARTRNRHFHYAQPLQSTHVPIESTVYRGRDSWEASEESSRAYELARLIKEWTPEMTSTQDLGRLLSGKGDLKGFSRAFHGTSTPAMFSLYIVPVLGSFLKMSIEASKDLHETSFLFLFPFLGFLGHNSMEILRALLAISFNPLCKRIDLPEWLSYNSYVFMETPSGNVISRAIRATDREPTAPTLSRMLSESNKAFQNRKLLAAKEHAAIAEEQALSMTAAILAQWPCLSPQDPHIRYSRVAFSSTIKSHWTQRFQNWEFSKYCESVSAILKQGQGHLRIQLPAVPEPNETASSHNSADQCYDALLKHAFLLRSRFAPKGNDSMPNLQGSSARDMQSLLIAGSLEPPSHTASSNDNQLGGIIHSDIFQRDDVRRDFTSKLSLSLKSLRNLVDGAQLPTCKLSDISSEELQRRISTAEREVDRKLQYLQKEARSHPRFKHLDLAGIWPRMVAADFVQMLDSRDTVVENLTRAELVKLALCIIQKQRLKRLAIFQRQHETVKFSDEILNRAHVWDVHRYTDWLVIEIEMDACIRPEQAQMALEMADSDRGTNGIFQLQMGKGKSSMIIPMLATLLPRKDTILRIIVPKPLLHQMGAILRQRLCRLLQRTLLHLPFSRATSKDAGSLKTFSDLHNQVLDTYGAVLTLPEHLQSFHLSGLQCLLDNRVQEGCNLMKILEWFEKYSRDVMDECDQILSPRTQLIYPSGEQTIVDGGSRRWNMIAYVLRTLFDSVVDYEKRNRQDLEVEPHRPGSFPFVHLRSEAAGDRLIAFLVRTLCDPDSSPLPLTRLSSDEQMTVRACLSNGPLSKTTFDLLESRFQDKYAIKELLTLRGLLGGGILLLALEKRWNVQYGLDLTRCLTAVPYEARGMPTAASEYGHPDVALTLTFLAYYHQGLSREQLHNAVSQLRLEQNPSLEWEDWITYARDLPPALRDWKAINLEDERLVHRLWTHLSHSITLINFYLHSVVFPRAAREFKRKLVSSSWDLPLRAPQITTGFSGTNDNSMLMPDSITPQELPSQDHTNAEVLWHLLEERNRGYKLAADANGKALSIDPLLDLISAMHVDVLLDAGALVLEMTNSELAAAWLSRREDVDAVAYFASKGMLTVLNRNGRTELLSKSRYSTNLTGCLLYLDQEHCRGTDTKLPANAKAVLTIGPRQPKDQSVQAAMRLRQLAHGQCLIFLAPPFVDKSIRDFCGLTATDLIDSSHVISWSIEQSCAFIESHKSLRDAQRRSYLLRKTRTDHVKYSGLENKVEAAGLVTEVERRTLYELYGPHASPQDREEIVVTAHQEENQQTLSRACAEEEQERQVDQETQEEQQRENPLGDEPHQHSLHPEVRGFVLYGTHRTHSSAYQSTFEDMCRTKAVGHSLFPGLPALKRSSKVFVTKDFQKTLKLRPASGSDHALRPVRFLAWNRTQSEYLLVVSPFEAEHLLEDVKKSKNAHILLYEPPRTRLMSKDFSELIFFSIPLPLPAANISESIKRELFLYSGAMFFPWTAGSGMRDYMRALNKMIDPQDSRRSSSDIGTQIAEVWRNWLGLRMHGSDGLMSPAGYLIEDKALDRNDRMFREESS